MPIFDARTVKDPVTGEVTTEVYQLSPAEEAARIAENEANQLAAVAEQPKRNFLAFLRNEVRAFDPEEMNILLAVYDEVKRYRMDNTAETPLIAAIQTVFPGRTKAQIGTTIENRVQNYLVSAATALAQKIKDTP